MTLREKILTEFQDWNSEKQLQEFQAYKQLEGYSPLTDTDYTLMEQILNNSNASIDCEDGNCSISYESPNPDAPIVKPVPEPTELSEVSVDTVDENEEAIEESLMEKEESKTKDEKSIWDVKNGIGAVSKSLPSDVGYFGFEAKMKASEFLALATHHVDKDLSYMENHFKNGGTFGLPFLGIDWYGDEEGSRKENKWKVDKHEGRHRVEFFLKEFGDKEITVSIFTSRYSSELRNRDLREDMFAKGIKLEPQYGAQYEGKKFEIADMAEPKYFDFKLGELPRPDGRCFTLGTGKTIKEKVSPSPLLKETVKSDKLANELNNVIIEIDDSLNVNDFALAVAKVLKNDYGSHNYEKFLEMLQKEI